MLPTKSRGTPRGESDKRVSEWATTRTVSTESNVARDAVSGQTPVMPPAGRGRPRLPVGTRGARGNGLCWPARPEPHRPAAAGTPYRVGAGRRPRLWAAFDANGTEGGHMGEGTYVFDNAAERPTRERFA